MKRDAWMPLWMLGIATLSVAMATVEREPRALSQQLAPARPAAAVVDEFDRLIQARFEDVRDGRFGVNRLGRRAPSHGLVFNPKTDEERAALERFTSAGWTPVMHVVEPRSADLLRGGVKGPVITGQGSTPRPHADPEIEGLAARAMAEKGAVQGTIGGVLMEARPVLATATACLRCHSDKKVGDPLGAVVYSFVPDPFAPLARR